MAGRHFVIQNCPTRENSVPTSTTYMNKCWYEIESSRVPILRIGLSERILSEGNNKLITVSPIILLSYVIYEIAFVKVNASEKEMKEEPKDGDAQQITGTQ